jgi:hypothetical protein
MTIDNAGNMYVEDIAGNRIQKFKQYYMTSFGLQAGEHTLDIPMNIVCAFTGLFSKLA